MNEPALIDDAGCGTWPTPQWLRQFRQRLRRWHRREGRSLPWRVPIPEEQRRQPSHGEQPREAPLPLRDPYRVWVSEIMLQQTTVAAVIPYYERFLAAFPTLPDLAAAEEETVLRLWEGLGYYSRARNLHQAAREVMHRYRGRLPANVDQLQTLPGIGRYTAGAIVSFAFDRPAPIVEANTFRLYTRLLGFEGDPRSTGGQRILWRFAERLVPRRAAGDFNQALLDLGATVCTPAAPECPRCPVRTLCVAHTAGRQQELPRAAGRLEPLAVTECAVIVHREGHYLLRRCRPGERWAGLWDFPRFAVAQGRRLEEASADGVVPPRLRTQAVREVLRLTGQEVAITGRLEDLRHAVTRYRIRLICLTAEHCGGRPPRTARQVRWATYEELQALPMSTTGRRLARSLPTPSA
jgi:A/G-specific adenine glycosylase